MAFTKAAWQAVGGYPEWLDYCEDLIFDFALRDKFRPFAFAPEAIAYFKPRSSLKSFFRQYYLYARGDGKANLWLKRHLIRYGTYLIGMSRHRAFSAISPWFCCSTSIGAALYLKRPYQRLRPIVARFKPICIRAAPGDRVGAHHPRGGRHRQNVRLSGRRRVATQT